MDSDSSTLVTLYLNTTEAYRKTSESLSSIYNFSQKAGWTLLIQVYRGSRAMLSLCLGRRVSPKDTPQGAATPTSRNFPVSVCDAHASDVGALARIHVAAFNMDRYVRLMYSECSHWKAISSMLESRYAQNSCIFQIAVIGKTNRIAGWICCSLIGDPKVPARNPLAHHEWATALAPVVIEQHDDLTRTSGDREDKVKRQRRRDLWEVVSKNSTDAQVTAMRDQRYLVLNTIVTDPRDAGRRVASELFAWAMRYADHQKLRIWAQVSPAAAGSFERAGFEEVAIMGLDLENFRRGDRAEGEHVLDLYEFEFMLREPGRRPNR